MGQIKFITSLALFTVFCLAVVGFAYNFSNDNDAAITVYNESNIQDFYDSSSGHSNTLLTESTAAGIITPQLTVTESGGTELTGGTFKPGVSSGIDNINSTFELSQTVLFGGDTKFSFVFTTIIALLVIIGGLLVWQTLRGGNVE